MALHGGLRARLTVTRGSVGGSSISYGEGGFERNDSSVAYYVVEVRHAGLRQLDRREGFDHDSLVRWGEHRCRQFDTDYRAYREERDRQLAQAAAEELRTAREAEAAERTAQARDARARIAATLAATLQVNEAETWSRLRLTGDYPEPPPTTPAKAPRPREPRIEDASLAVEPTLWDRVRTLFIIPKVGRVDRRRQVRWERAHARWQIECAKMAQREIRDQSSWEAVWAAYAGRKAQFEARQKTYNAAVSQLCEAWLLREPWAIARYAERVLLESYYPEGFEKQLRVGFDAAAAELVVEYGLPPEECIPDIEQVVYDPVADEFIERRATPTATRALWWEYVHMWAVRTLHELVEADTLQAIQSVVLNGRQQRIDRATGQSRPTCLLSVRAARAAIASWDLAQLDPAACLAGLRARVQVEASSAEGVVALRELAVDA